MLCLLTSCSKEEPMLNHEVQSDLSQAEIYLNTHSVPAIMFSYDVLNTETNVMTRFLIDNVGQVRTHTDQAFSARSNNLVTASYLQTLRNESKVVIDVTVTLDELVQNFNLLRTADLIEYDTSVEQEGPHVLKAMYGYYYDVSETRSYTASSSSSSSSSNECGGESTTTTTTTTTSSAGGSSGSSFRSILLEQKLGEDLVQKNDGARYTTNWLNQLNASVQEILED